MARNLVGLHYMSDLVVGVFLGFLGHAVIFQIIRLPEKKYMECLVLFIKQFKILELGFIIIIIEMSVLFADIRFLDALIFPVP